MQDERMNDWELDERLMRALERQPAVGVPADFAARVAAQVPVREAMAVPAARYGVRVAWIGMAVLLVGLMMLATRSADRTMVTVEWVLCGELVGIAAWLSGAWKLVTG